MAEIDPASLGMLAVTTRALGYVLDVTPSQLRADTPLKGIGADSVAVLVFADVVEGLGASRGMTPLHVDNERLRMARTVGELAESVCAGARPVEGEPTGTAPAQALRQDRGR